ncbi:envelope integrity protein Cei [Pseudonocardia bannensis]|uniref:Envelope integrity protein Cei n=1 Tax=Pseudonocardia bannensis TaxID=630973 RepID=A0A848DL21_9PSEU|nr:envelope integrity protein Cei [Pseudonocardia bannensis]NMH93243.1 envelope integrity protein Cei [Pseudonocardia bannensis]
MVGGAGSRPYQRRRSRPIIVVVSVLFAISAVTWSVVLIQASGRSGAAACTPPAQGTVPGEVLAGDALNEVAPVPASAIRVRVLNAGGQRGQANLVAAQLGDLGFAEAAPPSNDPLYPEGDLSCRGQLRFGPAGEGAASTLALVLPCTELVRDDRRDGTVDVAVGTAFGDVNPGRAARDALDQLASPAVSGGDGSANTGEDVDTPPAAPVVDPGVLENARDASC